MMSQPSPTMAASRARSWVADPMVGALAVLTVSGLALRAFGLNSQLWYDEIFSLVETCRPPLWEILTRYAGDIQHPLYSVLAHVSIALLGESAWTVRLPAVMFGVASIPLLFLLGRTIASTGEGLLAAALLTVSYHHVWFSQNARGYTVLLFFTLLSTLLFYRGLESRRWPPFLGYALAAALGMYTHLTFAFVVASHALTVLLLEGHALLNPSAALRRLAAPAGAIILTGLLTVALYAPILLQVIHFYRHGTAKMKALSTPTWALLETLRGLQLGFGSQVALVGGALLVGCGLWGYWRENRPAFFLLVLPTGATVVGLVVLLGKMYPRYLFLVAGFAILIVVRGSLVLGDRVAKLASPRRGALLRASSGSVV